MSSSINRFATGVLVLSFTLTGLLGCHPQEEDGTQTITPEETDPITRRNHPSPSPDGQRMVYHVQQADKKVSLYISNIDGSDERLLFASERMHAQEPRWSPDGEWIAFVGGPDYQLTQFALYVIKPDGSGLREVHRPEEGLAKSPFWRGDSAYLLYAERHREAGWARVHTLRLDGTDHQIVPLSGAGLHYHPRWGHQSNRLLVSWRTPDNATDGNLYVVDLATPDTKHWLTSAPGIEGMPAWSPDERFIVYYVDVPETEQADLFVVDTTTGQTANLTNTLDGNEYFPSFSKDGKRLFYQRFEADPNNPENMVSVLVHMPFDATALLTSP